VKRFISTVSQKSAKGVLLQKMSTIKQKTEGAMHIPQCTLRSFVICFAILMLLPVAGTAIAGTGMVTLPLFFFTNTGALSCKPGNLWFGKVMVGSSETLSATLANTGTVNITVSSLSETGAGYTLSGLTLPLILGPGKSAKFHLDQLAALTNTGAASVRSRFLQAAPDLP
jgi:hypothetical protein